MSNQMKKLDSHIILLLFINIIVRIFHHLIYIPPTYSYDTYDYLAVTNCLIIWILVII